MKRYEREVGSSPLARGTLAAYPAATNTPGLIPARAGNTPVGNVHVVTHGAHPRSRGEHLSWNVRGDYKPGSSPLARGTRWVGFREFAGYGLIPARAGNTPVRFPSQFKPRAHPRSRGEHPILVLISSRRAGSSPLARGTRVAEFLTNARVGLIPARAGNTVNPARVYPNTRAHPRSRGEHVWVVRFPAAPSGSSPLARGTHGSSGIFAHRLGLIPARAGNTPE